MGGLGPGIGGMEYVVIAIVALLVVGPERLPAMLHKLGKMISKARNMAGEFRASFDEMARQSELDDLRKEVEALRQNQGVVALGAEADAAFREIRADLNPPVITPDQPTLPGPDEWPDSAPVMAPLDPVVKPKTPRKKAPKAASDPKPVASPTKPPATPKPTGKPKSPHKSKAAT